MKEQQVRMKGSVGLAAPGGRLPPNSNRWSLLQSKLYNGHNRCEEVWGWRSPLPCPPLSPLPLSASVGCTYRLGTIPTLYSNLPPSPPLNAGCRTWSYPHLSPAHRASSTSDSPLMVPFCPKPRACGNSASRPSRRRTWGPPVRREGREGVVQPQWLHPLRS